MKKVRKNKWLIRASSYCRDCEWQETHFHIAVRKGKYHALKTGHTVDIETEYAQVYNPKEKR